MAPAFESVTADRPPPLLDWALIDVRDHASDIAEVALIHTVFMPQQTDPAIPTALSSISSELLSSKVRIVGRYVSFVLLNIIYSTSVCSVWFYDANSTTLWLEDERRGIPVDISLCLDLRKSQSWLREPGNKVMAVGYLERPEEMVKKNTRNREVILPN